MATTYTPRPGSLAAHACAWFKANPTRKLTLAEICGRWGGTSQTATAQLGAAEDAEFLLSDRVGRTDVYAAGPKLSSWTPLADSAAEAAWQPPAAAPAQVAAPAAPAKKARRPRNMPDPGSLAIDSGVPMPTATTGREATGRFDDVFARMKVGDSVAVTTEQGKPLFDAAARWAKRTRTPTCHFKFALRRVDENTSRIWRTE